VVVNTCAVTAEAVRQARQTIRALRRERPQAKIVVTGCAAQTEPHTFVAMAEADRVLGNTEKLSGAAWAQTRTAFGLADAPKAIVNDIMAVKETAAHLIEGFPTIRVPSSRCRTAATTAAPSASFPTAAAIHARCRWAPWSMMCAGSSPMAIARSCSPASTSPAYGADLPGAPKLGTLVKQILKHVPELKRLRLSSIDSVEADRDLLDAFAQDERLMPHLHLSLQSGDDLILKRMKRRHFAQRCDRVLRTLCAGCGRTWYSAPT
jgi:threonylcarbamoyladenosine tRNA methylthiotransferase MtaB